MQGLMSEFAVVQGLAVGGLVYYEKGGGVVCACESAGISRRIGSMFTSVKMGVVGLWKEDNKVMSMRGAGYASNEVSFTCVDTGGESVVAGDKGGGVWLFDPKGSVSILQPCSLAALQDVWEVLLSSHVVHVPGKNMIRDDDFLLSLMYESLGCGYRWVSWLHKRSQGTHSESVNDAVVGMGRPRQQSSSF